jgi:hypothetical protein
MQNDQAHFGARIFKARLPDFFLPVIRGQPSPTMRMMHISTNAPLLHFALVNGEYVFQFTLGLINLVTSVSVTQFTNSTFIT